MLLAPGSRLGPYAIVAPLGAGGMGEVYRAHDSRLGRDIALKLLPTEFADDPERLARFDREARTVAGLSHPNIVTLHSVEVDGAHHFLTMELVEGEGLDRHIMTGGLPIARVVDIALAIAEALVAAHERGVVHRDLKPANVMLTRDGRIKVLDFGLARVTDAAAGGDAGRTIAPDALASSLGQVIGTLAYMAPEQVRGEAADRRTDLFALGILLYELASGRRPFAGGSSADVGSAILRDAPAPLSGLRPGLPDELAQIVERCLEKQPRDRFQTANDVHHELRRLKKDLEGVTPKPAPAPADTPSIAVLPFVNMSRDEENEYFSDGLAEELLNVLSKIRGLRVAARSSAFTFKGKGATVAEAGQALNVATVLEGSVRKAGNRLRIAVQLVKVADGFHLWSETYDRTLDDIFAVQDDIAQAVVKELRTTLLGATPDSDASGEARAAVAAAAKGRGENGEAHRLFLQGRYLANQLSGPDLVRGIEHLRQAVELDPGYALAWASLSWAHAYGAGLGFSRVDEGNARAREAAERALELEPELAEAHIALATVQLFHDLDWRGAEASLRRALELAPDSTEVLRTRGFLAYHTGRLEEAVALCRRAVEQDPLSSAGYNYLGRTYRAAGRLPEAEAVLRKAIELSPEGVGLREQLALAVEAQGRAEEALVLAESEPADWARWCGLAVVHARAGRMAESARLLDELVARRKNVAAFQVAIVHAARGEVDEAFAWLEKALAQRDAGLTLMKCEPLFEGLHADSRWGAFLEKLGLAD